MNRSITIYHLLLTGFALLLLAACSRPKLLTEKYRVTKETPLYKQVMLSGNDQNKLNAGDTVYIEKVFEESGAVSLYVNGRKRYAALKDLEKIPLNKAQLIVSETSPLPPNAQQFLLHYVNYWKWPFWAITVGLVFALFILFSMGGGTEMSFSLDMGLSEPSFEFFPIWTFAGGLILGVWYFFVPEFMQGVVYNQEFLQIWPTSRTAWLILAISVAVIALNLKLLIKMLGRYKGAGLFVYGIYTILGLLSFVFAMYLAMASIALAIVGVMILFGLSSLSNLADPSNFERKPETIESLREKAKRKAKADQEAKERSRASQARKFEINHGRRVDPNSFR